MTTHRRRQNLARIIYGLALLAIVVPLAVADTNEVSSQPAGFYKVTCPGNSDTLVAMPFTRPPAYQGLVQSVGESTVTMSNTPNWTAGQFVYQSGVQSNTYYAFIASGAAVGQYYKITNNTANTLSLDVRQDIDIYDLSLVAVGDRLLVVPYWTFGTAFPGGQGVVASPSPGNRSTEVLIRDYHGAGTSLGIKDTYYFWNSHWRMVGAGNAIKDDDALPPLSTVSSNSYYLDSYVIVRHNTATGTTIAPPGMVPMTDLVIPIFTKAATKQDNLVALRRPTEVSLDDSGLGPPNGPVRSSPTPGNRTDELFTYDNSTTNKNKSVDRTYYYWSGAWRQVGKGAANTGTNIVFTPVNPAVIIRMNATPGAPTLYWVNTPTY